MEINVLGKQWTMQRFRERCSREANRMIWLAEKSEEAADAVVWLQACEHSFRTAVKRADYYDAIKQMLGLAEVFPELRCGGAIGEFLDVMQRVRDNDELAGILA
jgi:hypothetical protein